MVCRLLHVFLEKRLQLTIPISENDLKYKYTFFSAEQCSLQTVNNYLTRASLKQYVPRPSTQSIYIMSNNYGCMLAHIGGQGGQTLNVCGVDSYWKHFFWLLLVLWTLEYIYIYIYLFHSLDIYLDVWFLVDNRSTDFVQICIFWNLFTIQLVINTKQLLVTLKQ